MKLLYVHDCFGALAGAEASVHITATELSARGHEVGIIHGAGTGKNESAWKAVFPTRFGLDSKNSAVVVREALASFKPEVAYVNKMSNIAVLETLTDSGLPLVRMVHDHDLYCMRSYKYNWFTRRICTRAVSPWCLFPCLACVVKNKDPGFPLKGVSYSEKKREVALNRRFHRMLVVTQYMRQELLRNGFDPRRIELHPPVPRMGDPGLRGTLSRKQILYAGQILRGKGVDVLLEALALLDVPFECLILGEGNYRDHCMRLCHKLGLDDRVTFKGFVPQEELKSYYRECRVVAISSVWPEPIATIGLEVMRYGLPVVAFDAGGIKDWLIDGYNGFMVPWMDRRQYAERLKELLANQELAQRLGQNGLELVTQRYDFNHYISGLESMFHRVVKEASA